MRCRFPAAASGHIVRSVHDDDLDRYEGVSGFMRWWPKFLLGFAAWLILYSGIGPSTQFATMAIVIAYVHGRWLPWRFEVRDDGIELTFAFGRHLFLPKDRIAVRMENVGAVAG